MNERYRPKFHFTPREGWMNDPNGLVRWEDEWHLFFQYRTPRHWGHAVSRDLIRWDEFAVALEPDVHGEIFSGSAVVDERNTSGLFPERAGMVAIYTAHRPDPEGKAPYIEDQRIAISRDRGRTWAAYEGNPVLTSTTHLDFRDPKVFWHEATSRWVMSLATGRSVTIYTSPNLREWTETQAIDVAQEVAPFVAECPDLFPCRFEDEERSAWVLSYSWFHKGDYPDRYHPLGQWYQIGDFDGSTFHPSGHPSVLSYGDDYAAVTWAGTDQSRRVMIGWMNHWGYAALTPTAPWQGSMTIPREVMLRRTARGPVLIQRPVKELVPYRAERASVREVRLQLPQTLALPSNRFDMSVLLREIDARQITMTFRCGAEEVLRVRYHDGRLEVERFGDTSFHPRFGDRIEAPCSLEGGQLEMRILGDESSIEIFAQGGTVYVARLLFPTTPLTTAVIDPVAATLDATIDALVGPE